MKKPTGIFPIKKTSATSTFADEFGSGPGKMTEYGWWDQEIENDLARIINERGFTRIEAIVYYFNNI